MKWLRKHKQKIIWGVQSLIVCCSMTFGLGWTYLIAWFKAGLPIEWWSTGTAMVLGLLSMVGTFAWIVKTNKEI